MKVRRAQVFDVIKFDSIEAGLEILNKLDKGVNSYLQVIMRSGESDVPTLAIGALRIELGRYVLLCCGMHAEALSPDEFASTYEEITDEARAEDDSPGGPGYGVSDPFLIN